MISEKSIQEILDAAKIEEVVQDYVNLRRRGANLIGLCPFHHEKTPSFSVSPSRNIYKCFGCGRGGNAVQFLMEHEQMTYPEALRHLARKFGVEVEETGTNEEAVEQRQYLDSLYLVNDYARDFFQQQLFNTDRGRSIGLGYFKERGFREETIRKFGLGFSPDQPDGFTRQATAAGYDIELLRKLGLTTQHDRDFFRNRVMFTIHNLSGKVIGFAGRILSKDVKAPKYINTPETDIYNKSRVLYGAYFAKRAIRQDDLCILVEGYTDVLSLHQAGIENVVASSGTSLTEEQIQLIKRHTSNIRIIYDGDYAGIRAALRGLDMVLAQNLNVSIVMLPEGEDPDSYLQAVGASAFRQYIESQARDFILFKAGLLLRDAGGDPVKKTHAIKDIVSSIARIPDPLKRSLFIKECASIVQVDEQLLVLETNRMVTQELQRRQAGPRRNEASAGQAELLPAPPSAGGPEEPEGPGLTSFEKNVGDTAQEKDIVRILISGGDKIFDEEEKITVAEFIVHNIDDLLDDPVIEFESELYLQVVRECHKLLSEKRPVTSAYFTQHEDEKMRNLAITLLTTPYEYSENWSKRWDIYLQTQKMPEENFKKDAEQSIKRFRMRKINRMIQVNKELMRELYERGAEDYSARLQVDLKLKQLRNDLAKELGTVVLR